MIINSEIKEILRSYHITVNDGIAYLLSVYFDVKPSYTPLDLVERMNRTNILGLDGSRTLQWNVPLFEDQVTGFEWVYNEWLELFSRANREKKGGKREAVSRMKKFFSTYPDVRKDEIMAATEMYIRSVQNAKYLMISHYFISKGIGAERTENLYEWVMKYRNSISSPTGRAGDNNTIK